MEDLSKRVQQARLDKKMTVEELSKITLLPTSVINDIESGAFDKYKGDEPYVKMYLKKLGEELNLDTNELTQEYISLTQQIDAKQIEEEKAKQELAHSNKNEDTFIDKMSDQIKERKNIKPIHQKKSVYQDHYIARYVKYAIVGVIVIALIAVIFYTVSTLSSSSNSSSSSSTDSQVEGNVDSNSNKTKKESSSKKDSTDSSKDDTTSNKPTVTRTAPMNYSFSLADKSETFELKIEIDGPTWTTFTVNGEAYDQLPNDVYTLSKNGTLTVTFNKADFNTLTMRLANSKGRRIYINGEQINLEDTDSTSSQTLTLTYQK
ncbi:MAG: helix-turn-helix domain-containing protein [Thomasclavelia sp.]|nr:helix-turn-helix domain-containing protein [Thomasclavelia sp.]